MAQLRTEPKFTVNFQMQYLLQFYPHNFNINSQSLGPSELVNCDLEVAWLEFEQTLQ